MQSVPHWQLKTYSSVCVCLCVCACVFSFLQCVLTCANSVMCLLTERELGRGESGGNREPPGMLSTGLVNYCHSVISLTTTTPLTVPISHTPLLWSPTCKKTKTAAAAATASKGTITPLVFNLCYSFFLSHSLSSAVLCLSLYLSLPNTPAPTHLLLSFIKAFLAILFPSSTESYCSWQRSRSFIFSLQPSLCMHAGLVLPYDIQALSIKYAWTLEMKINFGNVLSPSVSLLLSPLALPLNVQICLHLLLCQAVNSLFHLPVMV